MRYYYFHYLIANDRHIGILLPVSMLTDVELSACQPAKFRCNRTIVGRVMMSFRFLKMAVSRKLTSGIRFSAGSRLRRWK